MLGAKSNTSGGQRLGSSGLSQASSRLFADPHPGQSCDGLCPSKTPTKTPFPDVTPRSISLSHPTKRLLVLGATLGLVMRW